MKRFLVVANPSARGGRCARRLAGLKALFPEGEFAVTGDILEAKRLAREADGFETVVACGGDGTVNAVASGVLANRNRTLKFGVLYAGTSPDFCAEHGIPVEPERAVETLRSGVVKEIPVLTANGEPFFCSMNIGMGAAVAEAANRLRPRLGDFLGTLWPVLRETLRARRYDITCGGGEIRSVAHALVTRMTRIAGGLKIVIPPLADDECALWYARGLSRFGCLRLVWNMYRGKRCGESVVLRGLTEISSSSEVALEYDGDAHGALPVAVAPHERKLRLLVPDSAKKP